MNGHARKMLVAVCAVLTAIVPATAGAQTPTGATGTIAQPAALELPRPDVVLSADAVPLKIRDWRWSGAEAPLITVSSSPLGKIPRLPRPDPRQKRSGAYRSAQRALAGFALGFAGLIAGTLIDSVTTRRYLVFGSVGAAAGATTGVLLVR